MLGQHCYQTGILQNMQKGFQVLNLNLFSLTVHSINILTKGDQYRVIYLGYLCLFTLFWHAVDFRSRYSNPLTASKKEMIFFKTSRHTYTSDVAGLFKSQSCMSFFFNSCHTSSRIELSHSELLRGLF